MRRGTNLLDRENCSQNIRHCCNGDNFGIFVQRVGKFIPRKTSVFFQIKINQFGAGLGCPLLPRYQVGMMLGTGEENFIARFNVIAPKVAATKLIPSVALRVKIISSGFSALMKCAADCLAFS